MDNTNSIEAEATALALENFAGALGGEYDPDDATDRAALEQLVAQERARLQRLHEEASK